jgi:AcrR family transcriptional regulator
MRFMEPVKSRRPYRSARREAQAQVTRERILSAARMLFARDGYDATMLQTIALEAGVAVQTVYAIFGSKSALLAAILEVLDEQAQMGTLVLQLEAAASMPREQLRLLVTFNRHLFEQGADVLTTLRQAGTGEGDTAAVWREGEERRRRGQARYVHEWGAQQMLRAGLEERKAGDILWTFTGPDVYRLLVEESGWSAAQYESWLMATLGALLLA